METERQTDRENGVSLVCGGTIGHRPLRGRCPKRGAARPRETDPWRLMRSISLLQPARLPNAQPYARPNARPYARRPNGQISLSHNLSHEIPRPEPWPNHKNSRPKPQTMNPRPIHGTFTTKPTMGIHIQNLRLKSVVDLGIHGQNPPPIYREGSIPLNLEAH